MRINGMKRALVAASVGLMGMLAAVSCKEPGLEHGHSFGHGGGGHGKPRPPVIVNYVDEVPADKADLPKDKQTGAVYPRLTFREVRDEGYSYPPAPPSRSPKKTETEDPTRFDSLSVETLNANCIACHSGYPTTNKNEDGSLAMDYHNMHEGANLAIACVDCHGGNWSVAVSPDIASQPSSSEYEHLKNEAHVLPSPKTASLWMHGMRLSSANPEIPGSLTLSESADYIRFVNPGDLHAARPACYNCHAKEVENTPRSMMAHGAMLWGAALYNNGAINIKDPVFGESYTAEGVPRALTYNTNEEQRAKTGEPAPPTPEETRLTGRLPALYPLSRWEVSQPGNPLRVFERGGRVLKGEIANPHIILEVEPGKPDVKLSTRGFGSQLRTDPVFIGLQKTRLLDPTLNLFGTNDHPGDYRASGCSACHVMYANDRSKVHSGPYAQFGNNGMSHSADPTIPKDEPGHPISHKFVASMPTSSCIVCHVHPGTLVMNSYTGFTWWDNETDGEMMYPRQQQYPTGDDEYAVNQHNPEQAAVRGLWSNRHPNQWNQIKEGEPGSQQGGNDFLERTYTDVNPHLKHTRFADYHGHGWMFRAVFKQDSRGNLLNRAGKPLEPAQVTPESMGRAVEYREDEGAGRPGADTPVHLKDIHLEKGMHCADCHFHTDVHGDGNLYGEARNAVTIECIDCHGTMDKPAVIYDYLRARDIDDDADKADEMLPRVFSGSTAQGLPEGLIRRMIRRFELKKEDDEFVDPPVMQQVSPIETQSEEVEGEEQPRTAPRRWDVRQTMGTRAIYAHTVRKDGNWGAVARPEEVKDNPSHALAHDPDTFTCYACHTSWTTSCFGCHLPMRANWRKQMLHHESMFTRNYTNYNFQTLRDDVYMLGIDGSVQGNKIVPIRSACAVMVSSQDALRNWLYVQQQTVSAEGFAGTAFSPYFPHTVRTVETKQCTDCHLNDQERDNNAKMAQLLLHGTNATNFIGRFAWVASGDGGLDAIGVAERDEPQAVIGSRLHEIAYPDWYRDHVNRGMKLAEAHNHHGHVLDVQARGEYAYAACGKDGVIIYDIANIDNKGFSERILTAPVSPLGQRFYVKTRYATSITSPSTLALDPTRPRRPENEEGTISRFEWVDGRPKIVREEPKETIPGLHPGIHPMYGFLYATDKYEGLVVIGNTKPGKNKLGVATLLDGDPDNNFIDRALAFNPGGVLNGARSLTFYGHYAYICADAGMFVVDLNNPLDPQLVSESPVAGLDQPKKVQFQFRYGFVVDADGLKTLLMDDPRAPRVVGSTVAFADARDVYLARSYAYIANGREGLAIVDIGLPADLSGANVIRYDAEGKMNDANAVRVAMTNNCLYAYVADGKNGLKVIQLTDASYYNATPGFNGFSPLPVPRLIAWRKTHGPALSLSEGLDRDRAVDESGNQLSVFGRRGARPFNLAEQQRLWLRTVNGALQPYFVTNTPTTEAIPEPEKPAEDEEDSNDGN